MVVTIMSIWFCLYLVLRPLEEHMRFPKFPKHNNKNSRNFATRQSSFFTI